MRLKTLSYYMCEICHTQYRAKSEAEACEAYHVSPIEIAEQYFKGMNVDANPYPIRINMIMSDGKTVTYHR